MAASDQNWEWKDDRAWKKYDAATCALLTRAAENSKVTISGGTYEVDLRRMKQKNVKSGYERNVRCLDSSDALSRKRAALNAAGPGEPGKLGATEETGIQAMFDKYKENDRQMGPSGVMQLLEDLALDPTSLDVLCVAWKMDAERMGYFSKDEFFRGCRALSVSNIADFKKKAVRVKDSLSDKANFLAMYKFAFNYSREEGQKSVAVPNACAMLPLVLGDRKKHTAQFVEFLGDQTEVKVLSLDTWVNFLEFSDAINLDCGNYDDDDSWPTLFVDYAAWVAKKSKKK